MLPMKRKCLRSIAIARYVTAFRKIDHYHSRVRVLKDISQLKKDATPIDASNPHGKKQKAGKFTSVAKFGYYFLDFLIGNVKIAIAKIKSTLVLVERYYYSWSKTIGNTLFLGE